MEVTHGRKVWVFATAASLLFHALLFAVCPKFQQKTQETPIIVRLVEKPQVAATVRPVQQKTAAKQQTAVVKQNISATKIEQKDKTEPVSKELPRSNSITDKSIENAQSGESRLEAAGVGSGKSPAETGQAKAGSGEVVDINTLEITKKVMPQYPSFSRKRKEKGAVLLLITIEGSSVTACKTEKSSGYARLDEAARRAVMQWKFSNAGSVKARVPIVFRIGD